MSADLAGIAPEDTFRIPPRWLLVLSCLSFIGLFGVLAYFNRLSRDDYALLHSAHSAGIFKGTYSFYMGWNARWPAILHSHFWLGFQHPAALFIWGCLTLTATIWATYRCLKLLVPSVKTTLLFAVLFVNGWFLGTSGIGESWLWICAAAAYQWSTISWLVLLSCAFHKTTTVNSVLMIMAAIYAGASNEVTGALAIVSFAMVLRKKNSPVLILAMIVLCVAYVSLLAGPGNAVRAYHLPEFSLTRGCMMWLKNIGRYLLLIWPSRLPMLLLFSIPWLIVSPYLPRVSSRLMARIILGWLILVMVHLFPISILTQDVAPDRVLSPLALYSQVVCIAGVLWLSRRWQPNRKVSVHPVFAAILALNLVFLLIQWPIVTRYAARVDQRIDYLKTLRDDRVPVQGGVVDVTPLPPSGWLLSSEISENEEYFTNQHLSLGLGLHFKVRKKGTTGR
ncbi:MAG: hypothetical protein KDD36_14860 [Flavobacteriales bacterium]|nr:hypothetical protein [Flavobacteriales bacterium]